MHSNGFFLSDVAGFLGGYYTFLAIMNGVAAMILWRRQQRTGWAVIWASFAGVMMILASLALSGSASMVPVLPEAIRGLVNQLSGPVLYTLGTVVCIPEILCAADGRLDGLQCVIAAARAVDGR